METRRTLYDATASGSGLRVDAMGPPGRRSAASSARAFGLVALLAPLPAPAQAMSPSLSWVRLPGAESCIAAGALARRVEGRLGRAIFVTASEADLLIEGRIERTASIGGGGWRATIVTGRRDGTVLGTRHLDEAGLACDAIEDALALSIALTIDPDAARPVPRPAPPAPAVALPPAAPLPAPTPPGLPPPPPPPAAAAIFAPARPAPPAGGRIAAGLHAATLLGLLPGMPLGFGLHVRVETGRARLPAVEVAATLFGETRADAPDAAAGAAGAGTRLYLTAVSALACPLERGRAFVVRACAGAGAGLLRARGVGFDRTSDGSRLQADGRAGLRLGARLGGSPVVATAGLWLAVPFLRTEVVYRTVAGTDGSLFRPSAVGGAADLGLGLDFP